MKLLVSSLAFLVVLHTAFSRSAPYLDLATENLLNELNQMKANPQPPDEPVQMQNAFKTLTNLQRMGKYSAHRTAGATVQEHLNAAIEGWWDYMTDLASRAYEGVKTGCSYMPLKDEANTQILATLGTGLSAIKGACDYINGGQATTEGLFGFTLKDLKNKGKQLLSYARAGCEKYEGNSDMAREYIGDKAQYLDLVCQGLTGNKPAVIQVLLDNTIRSVLEDKKARFALSSITN